MPSFVQLHLSLGQKKQPATQATALCPQVVSTCSQNECEILFCLFFLICNNSEPPRVGNMGQQSNYYSGQVVNGGEVAVNNSQGTGVGYEQAVFNPSGPGRGGRTIGYRIYHCIMRTFFPLKKLRKLRCVLYTESFVLDLRPSLACKQIHEMCPYTIICFELKS